MSDNYRFDIQSEGRQHFDIAMQLAFCHHDKAIAYEITEGHGLVFFWLSDGKATPTPYPFNVQAASDFAWHWLQTAPIGKQPDHDGDNGAGFRVWNEAWTHVDGKWQAFVAIKPVWMMYGK